MCGRFTQHFTWSRLRALLDLRWPDAPALRESYNTAPTQDALVVLLNEQGEPGARPMRWGLVPSWAKSASVGSRMINARAETLARKPAFRAALERRRCIVPVSGFYEWAKADGGKRPMHIVRDDREPMLLAGLWERWDDGSGPLETFTIITLPAAPSLRAIHDRMPAVLEPDRAPHWLGVGSAPPRPAPALPDPTDAPRFCIWPVSSRVNSPRANDARLIEPVPEDAPRPAEPGLFER